MPPSPLTFEDVVRLFADLYDNLDDAPRLFEFARVRPGRIPKHREPLLYWFHALREAERQRRLLDLIRAALRDTPQNEALLAIERQLQAQPDAFRALPSLPTAARPWGVVAVASLSAVATGLLGVLGSWLAALALALVAMGASAVAVRSWLSRQRIERESVARAAEGFVRNSTRRAFRGLYPYEEGDVLPGKERRTHAETIATQLRNKDFSFGVLSGNVGCGKTSFMRSAIQTSLKEAGFDVVFIRRPRALDFASGPTEQRGVPPAISTRLQALEAALSSEVSPNTRRFLLIDQFEEFFVDHPDPEATALLGECLGRLLHGNPPISILAAVRHDFLLRVHSLTRALPPLVYQHNLFELTDFTIEDAAEAIADCAKQDGATLDPPDFARVIAEELASRGSIRPPELQIVCTALRGELTETRYRSSGGAKGLLARYIEGALTAGRAPEMATRILRALCDFSPNAKGGARPPQSVQELCHQIGAVPGSAGLVQGILQDLILARLVYAIEGADKFVLVHDYLIDAVAHATSNETTYTEEANQLVQYYQLAHSRGQSERIPIRRLIFIARYADPARRAELQIQRILRANWRAHAITAFAILCSAVLLIGVTTALTTTRRIWSPYRIATHTIDGTAASVSIRKVASDIIMTNGPFPAEIRLWRIHSGELLRKFEGNLESEDAREVMLVGDYLLVATFDGPPQAIHLKTWQVQKLPVSTLGDIFWASGDTILYLSIGRELGSMMYAYSLSQQREAKIPQSTHLEKVQAIVAEGLFVRIRGLNNRPVATTYKISDGTQRNELVTSPESEVTDFEINESRQLIATLEKTNKTPMSVSLNLWTLDGKIRGTVSLPDRIRLFEFEFLYSGEYLVVKEGQSNNVVMILRTSDLTKINPDTEDDGEEINCMPSLCYVWGDESDSAWFWTEGLGSLRQLRNASADEAAGELKDLKVSVEENRLIISYSSGTIDLWDLSTGTKIKTLQKAVDSLRVDLSIEGKLISVSHATGVIRLYNLRDGTFLAEIRDTGDTGAVLYFDESLRRLHVWTKSGYVLRYIEGTEVLGGFGFFPTVDQPLDASSTR